MAADPNVNTVQIRAQELLDLIADKWTAILVYSLADGPLRHSQLQREIHGISQKMLTQTLRRLEYNGIVRRTVYPVVPPKVEYSLTPLGETLIEPFEVICQWAEDHLNEVESFRSKHQRTVLREQESGHGR